MEISEPVLNHLQLTVLTATFQAEEDCELPAFKGSTFRGAFGHSLKDLACHRRGGAVCDRCTLPQLCGYGAVFEVDEDSGGNRPVPYVFRPPLEAQEQFWAGDQIQVGFTLFGHSRAWLPWVVWTLGRMGMKGLGGEHAPWLLIELDARNPDGTSTSLLDSFDHCPVLTATDLLAGVEPFTECRIEFLTPTQIIRDGEVSTDLDGPTLMRRLIRRWGDILEAFCGAASSPDEYRRLNQLAESIVTTNRDLRLFHWERYSSRRGQRHGLPGLLGTMTLKNIPSELLPILWLGQWLHVGKSTAFGLGLYRVDPQV